MDAVRSVPVDGRCFKESRGENSMGAWEIRAWEEEFCWKSKLTLGMWGSRAWGAAPGMVEALGAFMCAQDGPPKSTGMSQHQLRARLAETCVK